MLLQDAINILDMVLGEYSYHKNNLDGIKEERVYDDRKHNIPNFYICFTFKMDPQSSDDEHYILANNKEMKDKILEAAFLWQDHLNINKMNRSIGI